MDTLRRFAYKIIFYETTPSSIPSDMSQRLENILSLNPEEPNICPMVAEPSQTSFVADILGENLQISSLGNPSEKLQESSEEDDETNNEGSSEEVSSEEKSSDGKILEETPKKPIITRGQKITQGLILELSVPTEGVEIAKTSSNEERSNTETTNPSALTIARFFQRELQAEKDAIQGNQKEIQSWYRYAEMHGNKFTMGGFINVSVVSPKTWSGVKHISLYDRDENDSHKDTQKLARTHSL
ncbi:5628_t:CDS:2 [Entrophospora sp. SA101]|nr:5628_t:CDS:2 [Entrophospora sp. SA101]